MPQASPNQPSSRWKIVGLVTAIISLITAILVLIPALVSKAGTPPRIYQIHISDVEFFSQHDVLNFYIEAKAGTHHYRFPMTGAFPVHNGLPSRKVDLPAGHDDVIVEFSIFAEIEGKGTTRYTTTQKAIKRTEGTKTYKLWETPASKNGSSCDLTFRVTP